MYEIFDLDIQCHNKKRQFEVGYVNYKTKSKIYI